MSKKNELTPLVNKLKESEKDLKSRLNEMKVRVVSEMIMNEPIGEFLYIENLEEELKEADIVLNKKEDETGYYEFIKKDYTKKLNEILSKKTKEEIYRNACLSYRGCCKFLYD